MSKLSSYGAVLTRY